MIRPALFQPTEIAMELKWFIVTLDMSLEDPPVNESITVGADLVAD